MLKDSTIKAVSGILGVVIIEAIALFHGIDGAMLGASMAIVGGIAGYSARDVQIKEGEKNASANN